MTENKFRILVVDDEKININLLRRAIEPDYIVQGAIDGFQAIASIPISAMGTTQSHHKSIKSC